MPQITKQVVNRVTKLVSKSGESVIDRIKPIGFDDKDGIKILLYGRSGTGKTTLWATFPGRTLAIICSGGFRPGELRSIDTPENRKRISHVVIHDSSEMRQLIDYANGGPFENVVLDHVSGLADLVLKEILGIEEIPAQKSWGMAQQQDYGQMAIQCKEILRSLLNLEQNVVIIAQERTFGEESNSEVIQPTIGPALSPSLAGWLGPACDYVCHTFLRQKVVEKTVKVAGQEKKVREVTDKVEYCLRTGAHETYMTKFRVPRKEPTDAIRKEPTDVIIDPSYEKIRKLIRGG